MHNYPFAKKNALSGGYSKRILPHAETALRKPRRPTLTGLNKNNASPAPLPIFQCPNSCLDFFPFPKPTPLPSAIRLRGN